MIEYNNHDVTQREEFGYALHHTNLIGNCLTVFLRDVETMECFNYVEKTCAHIYFNFEIIPPNEFCNLLLKIGKKKATRVRISYSSCLLILT
jgi:hypothetical protein